jgi:hypothetical protein
VVPEELPLAPLEELPPVPLDEPPLLEGSEDPLLLPPLEEDGPPGAASGGPQPAARSIAVSPVSLLIVLLRSKPVTEGALP